MPAEMAAPPKVCPKCKSSSMIIEKDHYGTYGSCITCGWVHEVLIGPQMDKAAEEALRGPRQRRRQPAHKSMIL